MAKVAVKDKEATAQPNSNLLKANSGSMNLTTPEMTEASKPIRNPPKAAIKLIFNVYKVEDVEVFKGAFGCFYKNVNISFTKFS
ncbi:MAG: hypothetical protein ACJAW1_003454 [Glaciecola sp.]